MTESDWNCCTHPYPMLEFLEGRASSRKWRLFAVACCRRIWHLLPDERSRRWVEMAEWDADAMVTEEELADAWTRATVEDVEDDAGNFGLAAVEGVFFVGENAAKGTANDTADAVAFHAVHGPGDENAGETLWRAVRDAERAAQCRLLRDLFGPLPFREVAIDPRVLVWNDGTVTEVAGAIYEEGRFDGVYQLGRLLQEAGCVNEEVLQHCLEQGRVHQRGCWVVDLALGKK